MKIKDPIFCTHIFWIEKIIEVQDCIFITLMREFVFYSVYISIYHRTFFYNVFTQRKGIDIIPVDNKKLVPKACCFICSPSIYTSTSSVLVILDKIISNIFDFTLCKFYNISKFLTNNISRFY